MPDARGYVRTVAQVYETAMRVGEPDHQIADAALYAAAPELLAALRLIDVAARAILGGPIGGKGTLSPQYEALRASAIAARAAIAKASGAP